MFLHKDYVSNGACDLPWRLISLQIGQNHSSTGTSSNGGFRHSQ